MKFEVKINGNWVEYSFLESYDNVEDFRSDLDLKNFDLLVKKELKTKGESDILTCISLFDEEQLYALDALFSINNIPKLLRIIEDRSYTFFKSAQLEDIGLQLINDTPLLSLLKNKALLQENLAEYLCKAFGWNANYGYITFGEGIRVYCNFKNKTVKRELTLRVIFDDGVDRKVCENFMDSKQRKMFNLSMQDTPDAEVRVEPNVHWLILNPITLTKLNLFVNIYESQEMDTNVLHNLVDCGGSLLNIMNGFWDYQEVSTAIGLITYACNVDDTIVERVIHYKPHQFFDLESLATEYLKRFRVKGSNAYGLFCVV